MERPYLVVDVFTAVPYLGNPLAVVLDASGLATDDMQRIAAWTNLSETSFLLPPTDPEADYRVRIFTPSAELPFAGHPTLGSCRAWLEGGGRPRRPDRIVQECGVGLVPVRRDRDRLAFAAPPIRRHGPLEPDILAEALRATGLERDAVVDHAWIDNGPGWLGLLIRSASDVLAIRPTASPLDIGVVGPHPAGHEAAIEVRAFFPVGGETREDPVTGSLNASVAQWLLGSGRLRAPYVATQGTAVGRAGRVFVSQDADGGVWVGGDVTVCIRGTIEA